MTPTTPDPLADERAAVVAAEASWLACRRALVLAAIERSSGNRTRAAGLLGVATRQLQRWVVDLDLTRRLDELALERGWAEGPSRPARALRGRLNARRA